MARPNTPGEHFDVLIALAYMQSVLRSTARCGGPSGRRHIVMCLATKKPLASYTFDID
jgi:hypothetical protein